MLKHVVTDSSNKDERIATQPGIIKELSLVFKFLINLFVLLK